MGAVSRGDGRLQESPWVQTENGENGKDSSSRRGRIVVGLIAAALLVLTAVCFAVRLTAPSDATTTLVSRPERDGEDVGVLRGGTGLEEDDVVVAIDGRALVSRTRVEAKVGDTLIYQVRRDGQLLDVAVPIRSFSLGAVVRHHWPSLLLVASMLLVGGYVCSFVVRTTRRRPPCCSPPQCWPWARRTGCSRPQALDLAGGPAWWTHLAGAVGYTLLWPTLLCFALVFPEPGPLIRRHPRYLVLVFLIPAIPYIAHLVTTFPTAPTPLARVAPLFPRPTVEEYLFPLLILLTFLVTYRRAQDHSTRVRLRWVAGSFAVAVVPYLLFWQLPILLVGRSWGHYPLHILFFLTVPLALGAAILRVQPLRHQRRGAPIARLRDPHALCCRDLLPGRRSPRSGRRGGNRLDCPRQHDHRRPALLTAPPAHATTRQPGALGERDDPYTVVSRLGDQLETTAVPMEVLPHS